MKTVLKPFLAVPMTILYLIVTPILTFCAFVSPVFSEKMNFVVERVFFVCCKLPGLLIHPLDDWADMWDIGTSGIFMKGRGHYIYFFACSREARNKLDSVCKGKYPHTWFNHGYIVPCEDRFSVDNDCSHGDNAQMMTSFF